MQRCIPNLRRGREYWFARRRKPTLEAKGGQGVAGSVFNYRDRLVEQGVEGLLSRSWAGARKPAVHGAVAEKFGQALDPGKFRQTKDALAWIAQRTRKRLTVSGERKVLHRLGSNLKTPRKGPGPRRTRSGQSSPGVWAM